MPAGFTAADFTNIFPEIALTIGALVVLVVGLLGRDRDRLVIVCERVELGQERRRHLRPAHPDESLDLLGVQDGQDTGRSNQGADLPLRTPAAPRGAAADDP